MTAVNDSAQNLSVWDASEDHARKEDADHGGARMDQAIFEEMCVEFAASLVARRARRTEAMDRGANDNDRAYSDYWPVFDADAFDDEVEAACTKTHRLDSGMRKSTGFHDLTTLRQWPVSKKQMDPVTSQDRRSRPRATSTDSGLSDTSEAEVGSGWLLAYDSTDTDEESSVSDLYGADQHDSSDEEVEEEDTSCMGESVGSDETEENEEEDQQCDSHSVDDEAEILAASNPEDESQEAETTLAERAEGINPRAPADSDTASDRELYRKHDARTDSVRSDRARSDRARSDRARSDRARSDRVRHAHDQTFVF